MVQRGHPPPIHSKVVGAETSPLNQAKIRTGKNTTTHLDYDSLTFYFLPFFSYKNSSINFTNLTKFKSQDKNDPISHYKHSPPLPAPTFSDFFFFALGVLGWVSKDPLSPLTQLFNILSVPQPGI